MHNICPKADASDYHPTITRSYRKSMKN